MPTQKDEFLAGFGLFLQKWLIFRDIVWLKMQNSFFLQNFQKVRLVLIKGNILILIEASDINFQWKYTQYCFLFINMKCECEFIDEFYDSPKSKLVISAREGERFFIVLYRKSTDAQFRLLYTKNLCSYFSRLMLLSLILKSVDFTWSIIQGSSVTTWHIWIPWSISRQICYTDIIFFFVIFCSLLGCL